MRFFRTLGSLFRVKQLKERLASRRNQVFRDYSAVFALGRLQHELSIQTVLRLTGVA